MLSREKVLDALLELSRSSEPNTRVGLLQRVLQTALPQTFFSFMIF